jgi:hypothetical protein
MMSAHEGAMRASRTPTGRSSPHVVVVVRDAAMRAGREATPKVAVLVDSPHDHSIAPRVMVRPLMGEGETVGDFLRELNADTNTHTWHSSRHQFDLLMPDGKSLLTFPPELFGMPRSYLSTSLGGTPVIRSVIRSKATGAPSPDTPPPPSPAPGAAAHSITREGAVPSPGNVARLIAEWEARARTPWNMRTVVSPDPTRAIVPHAPDVQEAAVSAKLNDEAHTLLLQMGRVMTDMRRNARFHLSVPIPTRTPASDAARHAPCLAAYAIIMCSGVRLTNDVRVVVTADADSFPHIKELAYLFSPMTDKRHTRRIPPGAAALALLISRCLPVLSVAFDRERLADLLWIQRWQGRVTFTGPVAATTRSARHVHVGVRPYDASPSTPDFFLQLTRT